MIGLPSLHNTWFQPLSLSEISHQGEPTGPRSTRGMRRASPTSVCHLSRWAIAGQREQVSQAERRDAIAAWRPLSWKDRTEVGEDTERRSKEISGEGKEQRGEGKCCLNEGTESLRGQEGRLIKCGDAETRGSGSRLSPMGKLHSVGTEVPRSSPRKGSMSLHGCYKVCNQPGFLDSLINRNW